MTTPNRINDLPGAPSFPDEVRQQLTERLSSDDNPQTFRTRHLDAQGQPLYTNRLALETSPYLLQHAHNPINWFPWGDEAFALARELDRPIFLSIGYTTCHWCHVMEEESFEDVEIAELINSRYIPIKVDREQRPDVDDIYMTAVSLLTGGGGWPMTIIMTPDGEPFYAGTYIPARDGDRGSRFGLLTVADRIADAYDSGRERIVAQAQQLSEQIAAVTAPSAPEAVPGSEVIEAAFQVFSQSFDERFGGIGPAPKFPQPSRLMLLLRYHRRTGNERAHEIVVETLDAMAEGGIYDQIGGGFHRYATDEAWLIPHFEKMLYDNAQLVIVYLQAFQVTGLERFARVAREVLDYVSHEMTTSEGGFYSATDADSEGEEGVFFTWSLADVEDILDAELAPVVIAHYGITAQGNFEGANILHVARPLTDVAEDLSLDIETVRQHLQQARVQLYQARQQRPHPALDDKIIASWNGLMISAFALGAFVLDEPDYSTRAVAAAEFLAENMLVEGRLQRIHRNGETTHIGFLDDYAFVEAAFLDVFELTGQPRWLEMAIGLQETLDEHFIDDVNGGYFFSPDDGETLLARQKPDHDSAVPNGNSVIAESLLRLYELTLDQRYREQVDVLLSAYGGVLNRTPYAVPRMLCGLDFYLDRRREIILVSPETGGDIESFLTPLRSTFAPNQVVVATTAGDEISALVELVPSVEFKVAVDGRTTAYVCEAGICQQPTTDPTTFGQQVGQTNPY